MKLLVLNDIHIADKPPLGRTEAYTDQVFTKLEECKRLAEACDFTVMTGDLFHIKRANYVSHALVQRLIDLFSTWPHKVYTIVGNHDLSEAGIASVPKQPIGVLFQAGVLEWLETDRVVLVGKQSVQLSPANYVDNIDRDVSLYSLQRFPGVDYAIKVSHGALVPPKKSLPFETTSMSDVDTTGCDLHLFGHLHWDSGVRKINGCWFAGLGSLSRVSRSTHDIGRTPRVLVVELDGAITKASFTPTELKDVVYGDDAFIPVVEDILPENYDQVRGYALQLVSAVQRDGGETPLEQLIEGAASNVPEAVQRRVKNYLIAAGF